MSLAYMALLLALPVFVSYIGEFMVSIINIKKDVKEPTHEYQNCYINQILISVGYVKVRESFCTWVIIWIDTTLDHIDTREIFPSMKVLTWRIDPNGNENRNIVKHPYPTGNKKCEILIINTRMRPTLVSTICINWETNISLHGCSRAWSDHA